jgi:hypothetical protein
MDGLIESSGDDYLLDKELFRELTGICARLGGERLIWTRCTGIIHGFHRAWEQNKEEWMKQSQFEGLEPSQVFAESLVIGIKRIMKEEYPIE